MPIEKFLEALDIVAMASHPENFVIRERRRSRTKRARLVAPMKDRWRAVSVDSVADPVLPS